MRLRDVFGTCASIAFLFEEKLNFFRKKEQQNNDKNGLQVSSMRTGEKPDASHCIILCFVIFNFDSPFIEFESALSLRASTTGALWPIFPTEFLGRLNFNNKYVIVKLSIIRFSLSLVVSHSIYVSIIFWLWFWFWFCNQWKFEFLNIFFILVFFL